MSEVEDAEQPLSDADARLAQATHWFLRVRSESADSADLAALRRWLESDPRNAHAYRQVSAAWEAVGTHASAPEIMAGRRDALEDACQAARRSPTPPRQHAKSRWRAIAASVAGGVLLVAATAWLMVRPEAYATDLGERRTLTLSDGSVITLDARSRIRVDYHDHERLIALERGQARFDVAKDPTRPFRVRAGDQTVIALGTQFSLELLGDDVRVTMIEGRVAVTGVGTSGAPAGGGDAKPPVELEAGEELRVREDGRAVLNKGIDVERAMVWQAGKMLFDNEPLGSAVQRVNRYSSDRIEVDAAVAGIGVSGIFNAGDSKAFIEAITEYFPVQARRSGNATIRLTAQP